ncbi:E3 SUMO-protein ligase ZBED1 [Labeo rohita]|uniref:E3 SUMO-protein ligase ZBED1 n=1 Tax=Labeo rohita TaxID=84645 RepID=A0ABQ8KZX0_LABRO|nr:E3 SUMO-protein ligase ZBED1 [Labeo rohita]
MDILGIAVLCDNSGLLMTGEEGTVCAAEGTTDYSESGRDNTPKRRKSALADLLGQTFNSSSACISTPSAASTAEQEMKPYQEAPALPLTDDPLEWCKSQAHRSPLLSTWAQGYLCAPGIGVSAE